jgi:hypothetical protein
MKFLASVLLSLVVLPTMAFAADAPISRRDGFLMMWNSLRRPAEPAKSAFTDLPDRTDNGSLEIDFAASRGIVNDDAETFRPDEPLTLDVALTWLFRTRSVAAPEDISPATLSGYIAKYPIASLDGDLQKPLSEAELLDLMRLLDQDLTEEVHEVSFYSEKFQGKGTAFGESFDMYAMTAAHRTYPYNTLVKVTNQEDGKSVTVRINDRGPYVEGRDMDLSFAAFTSLVPRDRGKLKNVTFERLGDVSLVGRCADGRPRAQRIAKGTTLTLGVPHTQPVGEVLRLEADSSFVVRGIHYPDGNGLTIQDWILPGEAWSFTPAVQGSYGLILGSPDGKNRVMDMQVIDCDK